MVEYRITEIAGQARVEPVAADGSVDFQDYLARAEAERAQQFPKIVFAAARGLAARLAGLWLGFRAGQQRRMAIGQLASLDDRMLRDIGLERSQIPAAVDGMLSDGTER